jgi:SAM-dependent methyltransferase
VTEHVEVATNVTDPVQQPAVHPVAAGGFAAAAPTYARIRPTYARAAIGAIKDLVPSGATVLDVAAGTGILAGQLRRARLEVLALEPVPEMLGHLTRTLPDVPAVRGVAECLPFADGSLGAVTVGEAFHWFDAPAALAEVRRVLRPGGVLVVANNRRDESVDWVARYGELVRSELTGDDPYRRLEPDELVDVVGGFVRALSLEVANPRPCSPRQLVDRAASTSFVADAEPDARARVLERVAQLAADHPDLAGRRSFELPYVTRVLAWRAT